MYTPMFLHTKVCLLVFTAFNVILVAVIPLYKKYYVIIKINKLHKSMI